MPLSLFIGLYDSLSTRFSGSRLRAPSDHSVSHRCDDARREDPVEGLAPVVLQGGCSFTGTITPDGSNKNFFDVSLTFGVSPCLMPNQKATGIAVNYLLSDGMTNQFLAGVSSGNSMGMVFAAER